MTVLLFKLTVERCAAELAGCTSTSRLPLPVVLLVTCREIVAPAAKFAAMIGTVNVCSVGVVSLGVKVTCCVPSVMPPLAVSVTRTVRVVPLPERVKYTFTGRSEEHTSELQSLRHLVCRLLLEKK